METSIFLSKIINLIYLTKNSGITEYDSTIQTSLDLLLDQNTGRQDLTQDKIRSLADMLKRKMDSSEFNGETFKTDVTTILRYDQKLVKSLEQQLDREYDENKTKKVISSISGEFKSYLKEQEAMKVINRLSYDTKFNRGKISNFAKYLREQLSALEPYTVDYEQEKDPAIVEEVDFDNMSEVVKMYQAAQDINSGTNKYITGFDGVNNMTNGGFRPGETVGVGALQHKYKTGFTLSLFNQLVTINNPIMTEEDIAKGLKPCAIRISTEDTVTDNLQWSFMYLKCADGEIVKPKDLHKYTAEEMAAYVKQKWYEKGWSVKLRKVNPSEWSITDLHNYILALEAEGYKVCICVFDYLTMLPTHDCTQGSAGFDKRDQLRRVKNFMGARKTLFITPLQLSTAAKNKLKDGLPDSRFLKEIAEKGFYADCGQLDQELDIELYVHLVPHNGEKYLAIGRGKQRGFAVLENELDRFIYYKFPQPNVPVMPDYGKEKQWTHHLPRMGGFDGGNDLLDEVLGM